MDQEKKPCPVCEAALPELEGMVYCPYCGMPVAVEETVEETEEKPLPEEKNMAGAEERKPLKEAQLAAREKYKALLLSGAGVKMTLPEDIYTLVIKGCENKEVLIECLSRILSRGEKAIRLAVGGMPAILLYKVDQEAITQVSAVLHDVDAVYAVVAGEFDYSSLYKAPDFIRLSATGKATLKKLPKVMWLGENVKVVSEEVSLDNQRGYLIITDNAFLFFSEGHAEVMLPAYQMQDMDFWEQDDAFFAEWVCRDGRSYRLKFDNQAEYDRIKMSYKF